MMQRRFSMVAASALVLLFATWTAAPISMASAQTADLQSLRDEVGQLRRELRDLNRQVAASGGGSVGTSAAAGSGGTLPPTLAARMEVRISQLERQISRMTGRIEELNHNVNNVQEKIDKVLSDIELRLAALEKGKPATAGGPAAAKRSTGNRTQAKPAKGSTGTAAPSGGDPIGGDGKQLASLPEGTPAAQYRYARGFLMRGEYDKAAGAFRAFVKKHPNSSLSGSAVYWLGETHYARKRYAQAAVLFAEGFKRYPKSVKAPDNLLKLGMSFAPPGQADRGLRQLLRAQQPLSEGGKLREASGGCRAATPAVPLSGAKPADHIPAASAFGQSTGQVGVVDDDAFAALMARFEPFETTPHIAVAVSGGADSMALAMLADRWSRRREGTMTALIVDHRLRRGSTREARQVRATLDERGIGATILTWRGEKPTSGIQDAARTARYRLLGDWCAAQGVLHLLIAQHRDDQIETVLMRADRGSGPDGLAGMAAIVEYPAYRVLRPVLPLPRVQLRSTLEASTVAWIDDPSNRDRRFARVRVRQELGSSDQTEDLCSRTIADVARAAAARVAAGQATAQLLGTGASVFSEGYVALDPDAVRAASPALASRALASAIVTVSGRHYPPRSERLERLVSALRTPAPAPARTLAGCRIAHRGDRLLVAREPAAAVDALSIAAPGVYRWDNRFDIGIAGSRQPLTIARLGHEGWRSISQRDPTLRSQPIPPLARPSLPAVYIDSEIVAIPHLGYCDGVAGTPTITAHFAPTLPLAGPRFGVA